MAKGRGLPPSFQFEVPENVLSGPVQLGDYLDEVEASVVRVSERASSPQPRALPPRKVEPRVVKFPHAVSAPHQVASSVSVPEVEEEQIEPEPTGRRVKGPPRKQLNLNPETLRMVDELLQHIQTYSGQKDAKASEMFHGLVAALYEARELLDFSDVQPRGRWGSPTARAFPVALKNVFRSAIAEWDRRSS